LGFSFFYCFFGAQVVASAYFWNFVVKGAQITLKLYGFNRALGFRLGYAPVFGFWFLVYKMLTRAKNS
jgi:uncharacterized membrane protein required for colicin V production